MKRVLMLLIILLGVTLAEARLQRHHLRYEALPGYTGFGVGFVSADYTTEIPTVVNFGVTFHNTYVNDYFLGLDDIVAWDWDFGPLPFDPSVPALRFNQIENFNWHTAGPSAAFPYGQLSAVGPLEIAYSGFNDLPFDDHLALVSMLPFPEPSTFVLLATGLVGLGWWGYKKGGQRNDA